MKKFLLLMSVMMVFSILFICEGCQTAKSTSLIGTVKQVIIGDSYYDAGKTLGGASVVAYDLLKANKKYDKYTTKCEEIYAALEKGEDGMTVGSINTVAVEVCKVAVSAKYGYAYGVILSDALRIGGAVADRVIAKKVDTVAANQFLAGFKDGVDEELQKLPPSSITPVEKEQKKPFECPDGNCTVTIANRKVSHQMAVAQELIDGKYADPNEKAPDEYTVTKYKNIVEFIERCKVLNKFKVKKTDLYIKKFTIEGGALKTIEFKMIWDGGEEIDVDCVGCVTIPEIEDLE